MTVESDKASMEIPSSHAGVVKELKVKLGDKVKQGTLVLVLEAEGASRQLPRQLQNQNRPKPLRRQNSLLLKQ
jgi:pyruvate/2-oxoglutarate dehydrogenase complex dihydrolipoamide acyltransferase (E2) component